MTTPPVAVCLTTYNRAAVLPATLESIIAQRMGDFELIISDDGSKDATEEICRSYTSQDKRVSYFRNPRNLKMPGNLNSALARASAPLIANLHDGDVYRPDLLEQWRNALDQDREAAFVFNALEAVGADGSHRCFHSHSFGPRIDVLQLTRFMLTQLTSPVWGTVMARRECYESVGYFKPKYGFISDVEMWMRLNADYPVAYIKEPLIKIAPREVTHPYSYLDWDLEQIGITIHRDIISLLAQRGMISSREALRRLRKLRERRWLFLAGSCARRRRRDLYLKGMALFGQDESLLLRMAGRIGLPFAALMNG